MRTGADKANRIGTCSTVGVSSGTPTAVTARAVDTGSRPTAATDTVPKAATAPVASTGPAWPGRGVHSRHGSRAEPSLRCGPRREEVS